MTVSSIFLTSGMRENLFSLQNTEDLMERTQNRLATGLKINSSLDDPINFFAAQGHRQRATDLAALKDGMNEGVQTVKAATNGIEGLIDLVAQIKSLVTAYQSADGTGQASLTAQLGVLTTQMGTMASDASYKGVNLLASGTTLTVSFNEAGTSSLGIAGINVGTDVLGDAVNGYIDDVTLAVPGTDNAILDSALSMLRTASQTLASNLAVVTARQTFATNMINTLNTGADNLTLADMNEESANMLMLQTRQALATSSLGIASDAAQAVLRLF